MSLQCLARLLTWPARYKYIFFTPWIVQCVEAVRGIGWYTSDSASWLAMQFLALLSGGKDSCFALWQALAAGHTAVAVGHLIPQQAPGEHVEELDSWTFQTVGHQAVPAIAEALGLPYIAQPTLGLARQQGVEYHSMAGRAPDDEVEDAARLIARAQMAWPELQAVCVGAILSNYQRCRMEAMYVSPVVVMGRRRSQLVR